MSDKEYFDLPKDTKLVSSLQETRAAAGLDKMLEGRSQNVYFGYLLANDKERWLRNYLRYCDRNGQAPINFVIKMQEGIRSDRF